MIEEEDLCERSRLMGEKMVARIQEMKNRNDTVPIGDIRNLGAMVAFELVSERGTHAPNPEVTKAIGQKALEKGLILISCGIHGNTIRILAPLTTPDEQVDEGLSIIEEVLVELGGVAAAVA